MKDSELFKANYYLFKKQQMMVRGMSLRELAKKTGIPMKGSGRY